VKLGLLPGSGGTQRAPRLMGAAAALRLMTVGDPIDAKAAVAAGLADALAEGDLVAAARAHALTLAEGALPPPVSARMDRLGIARGVREGGGRAREARGDGAADRRLHRERARLLRPALRPGAGRRSARPSSRCCRTHAARRCATSSSPSARPRASRTCPAETKPRAVARAAVLGSGTMGAASPCASPMPASPSA
jgi:3-hydroxyacyl-CoA dehydrogenase